jgi:hypothetical protein
VIYGDDNYSDAAGDHRMSHRIDVSTGRLLTIGQHAYTGTSKITSEQLDLFAALKLAKPQAAL